MFARCPECSTVSDYAYWVQTSDGEFEVCPLCGWEGFPIPYNRVEVEEGVFRYDEAKDWSSPDRKSKGKYKPLINLRRK